MVGTKKPVLLTERYGGYYHRDVPQEDEELTHVGPGTPCGEYLRRYWQPVAVAAELKDLPHAIRIMGEDLVVFRDGNGQVGLLELHCSHRGTSLEFGLIEENGIRCCYHGWMFGVDGRILDTPGEPPDSTYKERLCHGAYPVHEYKGLIFAYMGPPDKIPPFPIYDIFEMQGCTVGAGVAGQKNIKPCNWLQVIENVPDLVHEPFLHARASGIQFIDQSGRPVTELLDMGEYDFIQTPRGILSIETRRVGDHIWSRQLECIVPNMANLTKVPVFPPKYAEGQDELGVLPKVFRWRVPVDDTNTLEFHLYRAREGDDTDVEAINPGGLVNMSRPSYEDAQRHPGDYEAQVSQRPIAIHAMEHLATTDRGVIMFRRMVKEGIKAVKDGKDPVGIHRDGGTIPTCSNDTVVRKPSASTPEEDRQLIKQTGLDLAERYLNTPPAQHHEIAAL
jgi:phenylpropionate dioxygenase-like ring-hydroxylating dioxygenase large terminal subunit